MKKSVQDTFCEALALTNGTTEATKTTVSDVLDFGSHGDDILFKLFIVGLCTTAMASQANKASTVTIHWQTSDAEAMSNPVNTLLTPTALGDADLAANSFTLKNLPLPRDLKRYNRLLFTITPHIAAETSSFPTTPPAFTVFITDTREEPLA